MSGNQDEFSFPGRNAPPAVEKTCRKILRRGRDQTLSGRGHPLQSVGRIPARPPPPASRAGCPGDAVRMRRSARALPKGMRGKPRRVRKGNRSEPPLPPSAARGNGPEGFSVDRGKDRRFILPQPAPSFEVRKIVFSPRLFLDSPIRTPYLVSVVNIHHKIRYHKSETIPPREHPP